MMVLLFVRTVDVEVGNRLLIVNFRPVQVQAISVIMVKVCISSNVIKPFSGEGDVVAWLKKGQVGDETSESGQYS